MAKTYKKVGSLRAVATHLKENGLTEFESLDDVISFQNQYDSKRRNLIAEHQYTLEKEKVTLAEEISELSQILNTKKISIESELRQKLNGLESKIAAFTRIPKMPNRLIARSAAKLASLALEISSVSIVFLKTRNTAKQLSEKRRRYRYLDTNFKEALLNSLSASLGQLDKKKQTLDQIDNLIAGAIGETKVANELAKLSDEYYLINDFTYVFDKAIYYQREATYIKSIQIDHLLISRSGIFIIETKNWSEHSLRNSNLRSPIQQIHRTSNALYRLITSNTNSSRPRLPTHHWGQKKIPTRNLVVLLNQNPREEFDFVKILSITDLLKYIRYFKPVFSIEETEEIAGFLKNLADHN